MSKTTKGIIFLLASSLIYSSLPIFIRFLSAEKVQPMSQVLLRYLFAFAAAWGYFKISKAKFLFEKKTFPLLIILAVFGYALTNLFFTYGMIYTQVSTALFIFYSFAIITPLLAFFLLKEKANLFNWISMGISFLALVLLFQPNSLTTWKIGGVFALLSALGQSLYLIGRRKLVAYSSAQFLLTSTFCGVITLGILVYIFEKQFYFGELGIRFLSWQTWLAAMIAGFINFGGWFLMSRGFQLVKASLGSLIMLVENVFVVLIGYLFLKEVPGIMTYFGGFLIISAAVLVTTKGDNS